MPRTRPTTPDYGTRPLQLEPKCEGLDVWELQIKLIGWGSGSNNDGIGNTFDPVRVTGIFDRTTADAIRRFQKAHTLPVTGIAGAATLRAIDAEAALHPVMVHDMKCPCASGKNTEPIVCRCDDHPNSGAPCSGFGGALFKDTYLTNGKKLADGTDLTAEKLDLYDCEEHAGMDKALLWAVRALCHRAVLSRLTILAGYRCWQDNYHQTDPERWRHRRVTLNFGKAIEFVHAGTCVDIGEDLTRPPCAECARIRGIARDLCGFQLRWQEPDRVSVAEAEKTARPPATPYRVHIDTVRRLGRHKTEFVKTHFDGVQPIYPNKICDTSFPVDLGDGIDLRTVSSSSFFEHVEAGPHGGYPVGLSRNWHGGVHFHVAKGTEVRAMASGEVIACRVGEAPGAKPYGSRNFVLIRHKWGDKTFYSLSMHLDDGAADDASTVPWRKKLFLRTKPHVVGVIPSPAFHATQDATPTNVLYPKPALGLAPGVEIEADAGAAEANPKTALDAKAPDNSLVVKLATPPDTYLYTKLEDKIVAKLVAADATLTGKLTAYDVIPLTVPIPVEAGELIGFASDPPTADELKNFGSFLHVETFSAEQLLTGAGYVVLDGVTAADAADRKKLAEKLATAKLAPETPDKVLLPEDLTGTGTAAGLLARRSAILKMASAWSADWAAALNAPPLSFLDDGPKGTLGSDGNDYRWWAAANPSGHLPPSDSVFHFHPIALILQIAFKE